MIKKTGLWRAKIYKAFRNLCSACRNFRKHCRNAAFLCCIIKDGVPFFKTPQTTMRTMAGEPQCASKKTGKTVAVY
ncbi:MAG: hypothetical protein IKT26_05115, partial [Bacteroidaceae bacterium]|nr:hypothetical protein [Bacteroidaceae bacterium]